MTDAPSDQELLSRIVQQDKRAMEVFYRRHSGPLSLFLKRTVSNPADVSEVVNTVMLEVWRKGHSYAGQSSVRTWLYSMARFKAVDALRAKARFETQEDIDLHEDLNCQCDLQAAQEGVQESARVRLCVDELKPTFRQVVWLAFFEEMPYTEIAEVMHIPTGTVKTRMMQAKKLLMNCLGRG